MSLIRTRENKFYLQKIFEDGSVVRWECPGLGVIKNSANYEYFSVQDIDNYGGVLIPGDIQPSIPHDRPRFTDAVYTMNHCRPMQKLTRRDRREYCRYVHSTTKESPTKYRMELGLSFFMYSTVFFIAVLWLSNNREMSRLRYEDDRANKGFIKKVSDFAANHPEHTGNNMSPVAMTPGQENFIQARANQRGSDFMDPNMASETGWKIRHAWHYGHWPKGLRD